MNASDGRACAKPGCDSRGKPGRNIVDHGSFATKAGRRRRYRCTVCGGTLSTNMGTAYSGLRCARGEFEQVVSLRVEGVSISATARVAGRSRNTVARWLDRASTAAERFNHRMLWDVDIKELPTRRNNRVVRVARRVKLGTASRLKDALLESEDSGTLNTSFVERLNLTIRQASAYLGRRSPGHARGEGHLHRHIELVRCYYNFVRPHSALRFGRETRTPAMQAGLVSTRSTLSDSFTANGLTLRVFVVIVRNRGARSPTFSWPHEQQTAA